MLTFAKTILCISLYLRLMARSLANMISVFRAICCVVTGDVENRPPDVSYPLDVRLLFQRYYMHTAIL